MSNEAKKKNNIMSLIIVGLIIFVLVLFGIIIYLKFYSGVDNNNNNDGNNKNNGVKVETEISDSELDLMKKVSENIFFKTKEKLNESEITDVEKFDFVLSITSKNFDGLTGTEMKNTYKKYTGKDMDLVGIPCGMDHPSGSNFYLIYDSKADMYKYDPDHPGHGGAGDFVRHNMYYVSSERKDNAYKYVMAVFFDDGGVASVGPNNTSANIYTSYADAIVRKNSILDATKNTELCIKGEVIGTDENGNDAYVYDCNYGEIYKNVKNKVKTFTFEFEKVEDSLLFKNYHVN